MFTHLISVQMKHRVYNHCVFCVIFVNNQCQSFSFQLHVFIIKSRIFVCTWIQQEHQKIWSQQRARTATLTFPNNIDTIIHSARFKRTLALDGYSAQTAEQLLSFMPTDAGKHLIFYNCSLLVSQHSFFFAQRKICTTILIINTHTFLAGF